MKSRFESWRIAIFAIVLTALATASAQAQDNLVTDPGFEPVTTLEPFFRSPGDPWIPGEWNAENADVVAGPTSGITPLGTQMLRINSTGGTHSQVNQIITVTGLPAEDCCRTVATFSVRANTDAATAFSIILQTGTSQSSVGTLTGDLTTEVVAFTTDGDSGTWEVFEGSVFIPSGANFVELQISSLNSQIPGIGLFIDDVSVVLENNLIADGSFDPGTPLLAFSRSPGNPWLPGEWNAEAATVTSGPTSGIKPKHGSGMLRINAAGGSSSQVNQIIALTSPVSALGDSLGRWSVCVNAPAATTVTLHMRTGDGQTTVGTLTNLSAETVAITTDANPATWERLEGTRFLPAGTTHLEYQLSSSNAQIPADGVFADCASVVLPPNRLTDHGFEPGTLLFSFFRSAGDPYIPGEWNVEDADVLVAPTSGVTPRNGTGMLRINSTGGATSQINQIISLPVGGQFGTGQTQATYAIYVNTTVATPVTLHMRAGDGQNALVGTLTNLTEINVALTTDADPNTWELLEGSRVLPAGTTHLEFQVSAPNGSIGVDGIFIDQGRITYALCQLIPALVPILGVVGSLALVALLGRAGASALRRSKIGGIDS